MIDGNQKNPKPEQRRVTFTVSKELYDVMSRLKDLTGKPLTFFPTHVLEESIDIFDAIVKAHETAITDKNKALEDMENLVARKMVQAAKAITND